MTRTISCFYMSFENKNSLNIIFIKFENYIKVIFNCRSVILTSQQLISNYELFQIYLLSLVLTEDTTKIYYYYNYGIYTRIWENFNLTPSYKFINLEKTKNKNPFNSEEPKRPTSSKKINKFMWIFNKWLVDINPVNLFHEYYSNELKFE
jgi:hypothetical protein|uniref:Uncharacterized protein n=1 Tax=viral metagenome TaxID=1070528 RepID=A0A6C0LJ95_9ZZZZ